LSPAAGGSGRECTRTKPHAGQRSPEACISSLQLLTSSREAGMPLSVRLLACISAAVLAACENPAGPRFHPHATILIGSHIVAHVGEVITYAELSSEGVSMVAPEPPLATVGDTAFRCASPGTGRIEIVFDGGRRDIYHVRCVGPIVIELGDGINVDGYFGLDVSSVSQSDGLLEIVEHDGDYLIICKESGKGTLWVFFRHSGIDFYDLTCHDHDQGSG
jgi:hypothetical protein